MLDSTWRVKKQRASNKTAFDLSSWEKIVVMVIAAKQAQLLINPTPGVGGVQLAYSLFVPFRTRALDKNFAPLLMPAPTSMTLMPSSAG